MRSLPEWIGKNDDEAVPDRVRVRVFESKHGRCHKCERKVTAGEKWTCEHLIAIANGGQNRESNLDVTCDWCLPAKNRADAKIKTKGYRIRKRNLGLRKKSRLPGGKDSPFRIKLSGEVVPR